MTTVGIITQARMTSSRLPGKVLKTAGGTTMLAHHLIRLRDAGLPVIVATTTNATDDPVVDHARELGAEVFRGSEEDVLARFAGAARAFGLDGVVRVTSDCPLIDGALVRAGVSEYLACDDPCAYVSNTQERSYPRGFDFEVFSTSALFRADREATSRAYREHVTPYLYDSPGSDIVIRSIRRSDDASRLRVTLDTVEDLELIRRLIEEHQANQQDVEAIIGLLESSPELVAINAAVSQKQVGAS